MRKWIKDYWASVLAVAVFGVVFYPTIAKATIDFSHATWNVTSSSDNPLSFAVGQAGPMITFGFDDTASAGPYNGSITVVSSGITAASGDKITGSVTSNFPALSTGTVLLTVSTPDGNMFSGSPTPGGSFNKPTLSSDPTVTVTFTFSNATFQSQFSSPTSVLTFTQFGSGGG